MGGELRLDGVYGALFARRYAVAREVHAGAFAFDNTAAGSEQDRRADGGGDLSAPMASASSAAAASPPVGADADNDGWRQSRGDRSPRLPPPPPPPQLLPTLTRTVVEQRGVEDDVIDIDARRALLYVYAEEREEAEVPERAAVGQDAGRSRDCAAARSSGGSAADDAGAAGAASATGSRSTADRDSDVGNDRSRDGGCADAQGCADDGSDGRARRVTLRFRRWLAYLHATGCRWPEQRRHRHRHRRAAGVGSGCKVEHDDDDGSGRDCSGSAADAFDRGSPPTRSARVCATARRDDELRRDQHVAFLRGILDGARELPASFAALHASQTWLCFWIAHSLDMLGEQLTPAEARGIVRLCRASQAERGGFGGGPGHLPHAAATYAAVMALCIAGTVDAEAYAVVDRRALAEWIRRDLRVRDGDGDGGGVYRVTTDGECDARALYCVLATASVLGILDAEMARGCAAFVRSLRAFDGGFGGEPGNESHGGYAYCAVASMRILRAHGHLGDDEYCELTRPVRAWVARRQLPFEGGFQGRTHKLVDACYSFWLGALAELCGAAYDRGALALYIRRYCQAPSRPDSRGGGGLCDKPGAPPDFYHTCYALAGLAIASAGDATPPGDGAAGGTVADGVDGAGTLRTVDPTYNLVRETLAAARRHIGAA